MKKIFITATVTLLLTSCTEITDGLRDISQGTFVKNRLPNPFKQSSAFYDSLVNLSQGKATSSIIQLKTSNKIIFKSLNNNALEQTGKPNGASSEILEKELQAHNIKLKENKNYKKCKSYIGNHGDYVISTYEFMLNGKKIHIIESGSLGSGTYPNPIFITTTPPCKLLDSIDFHKKEHNFNP